MHPVVSAYADPKVRFIQRYVPLRGPVLDVGCGNCIFTLRFAQAGADVTGLDFSRFLLGQNAHPRLICGDATVLPFPDESFEATFEANVLHHVPERERVIGEMARTSRRCGPAGAELLQSLDVCLLPGGSRGRNGLKSSMSRLH